VESGTGRNLSTSEIKFLSEKLRYIFLPFLCVRGAVEKKVSFLFREFFFLSVCISPKSLWFIRQISPEFGFTFSFFVYQMSNNYYYCFGSVLNADPDQP